MELPPPVTCKITVLDPLDLPGYASKLVTAISHELVKLYVIAIIIALQSTPRRM